MSRKSRRRLMEGQRRTTPGQVVYGYTSPKHPISPVQRKWLLAQMRAASESDREGVREYLKQDGSKKALALLAEFEDEWAKDEAGAPAQA